MRGLLTGVLCLILGASTTIGCIATKPPEDRASVLLSPMPKSIAIHVGDRVEFDDFFPLGKNVEGTSNNQSVVVSQGLVITGVNAGRAQFVMKDTSDLTRMWIVNVEVAE